MDPEAVPRESKGCVLEQRVVVEILRVGAAWSVAMLCKGEIVPWVDAVDGIECICGIAYCAAKGANGILVDTLGYDTST